MSHLKALTFTAHKPTIADPTAVRRQRLVERLEEQRQLAKDPTYAPMVRRWKKDENGVRQPVDSYRRIKPWWRRDATGSLVLVLKKGLKTLELEKGKAGIVVGSADRLEKVIGTLIAAVQAGELDSRTCKPPNQEPSLTILISNQQTGSNVEPVSIIYRLFCGRPQITKEI